MRRKEDVSKVAKQFNSRRTFQIGSPADYQAARRGGYLREICEHMTLKYKYRSNKELISIAQKYTEKCLLKKNEPQVYDRIIQRGLVDIAFTHMPKHAGIGKPGTGYKWDYGTLKQICSQYDDLKKFIEEQVGAYLALSKKNLIEELTSHMKRRSIERTNQEIAKEALKCSSRSEFRERFRNSYAVAHRRKILNEICSHMRKSIISSPERTILGEILKYFPDAKKFRATKLRIPAKEYIKTLEVDILVKELGKGIEYDGRWHHSFEGLKRGHPTWPIEDIKKYHEIKDAAFLALGIQILHIKQEEWKIDKQSCIHKCLVFLGVK